MTCRWKSHKKNETLNVLFPFFKLPTRLVIFQLHTGRKILQRKFEPNLNGINTFAATNALARPIGTSLYAGDALKRRARLEYQLRCSESGF